MIHGLKQNLATQFKLRMIDLRNKELQLIISQANGASIVFSLLTGIMSDSMVSGYYMYDIRAVGGTIETGDRYRDNRASWDEGLELIVCFSMYTSIFMPIVGIWFCTILTLLGPRCALGGAELLLADRSSRVADSTPALPPAARSCE